MNEAEGVKSLFSTIAHCGIPVDSPNYGSLEGNSMT